MRSISVIFAFLFVAFVAGGTASAWENKGWSKLGEREVNGKVDTDTIEVGKYEGEFTKLQLVVEKDELELLELEVTFGNGDHWKAEGAGHHYFKSGESTHQIDLPGNKRIIKSITLKYKNVGKRGNARIEVWGRH